MEKQSQALIKQSHFSQIPLRDCPLCGRQTLIATKLAGYTAYRIDCTTCGISAACTDFDLRDTRLPAEIVLISRLEEAASRKAGVTK